MSVGGWLLVVMGGGECMWVVVGSGGWWCGVVFKPILVFTLGPRPS